MLNEERYMKIIEILKEKRSATIAEFSHSIGVSESTIRRDLSYLHDLKKLTKIFGGAVLREELFVKFEDELQIRKTRFQEEKRSIGQFAASLINDGDCVYMDAGSTTGYMPDFIKAKDVLFVTNSPGLNYRLVSRGFHSILTGGELRIVSDILFGQDVIEYLQKFNFTKGFFGVDAVSLEGGFAVALPNVLGIKQTAIKRSQRAFVLADSSKFDTLAAVTFAQISDATIITDKLANPRYRELTEVYEVGVITQ
jgi:DeoR family fructose operon transcriptional repressor